jgi:hypothetical protein
MYCTRVVSEVELFHCTVSKLLMKKTYYVLFLIPVFNIQVTSSMHFAGRVRTWCVARLSASWLSFMRAITSIMCSSSSRRVSPFLLYILPFIQPHEQKSNGLSSRNLGGPLLALPRPIQSVIEMLHHKSSILRRGSVMPKVHSNPCSQRNKLYLFW